MLGFALLCTLCSALLSFAMLCYALLCCVTLCYAMLCLFRRPCCIVFCCCAHLYSHTPHPLPDSCYQMDNVRMDFRAEQYEQVLCLKDSIAALTNWQTFFPYRPKHKTPLQDPRAWWR